MRAETVTMPVYWASALINGDTSGMEPSELAAMARHLETLDGGHVVSCDDDSRFTWSYRLYGGTSDGGEVCTFTVLYPEVSR